MAGTPWRLANSLVTFRSQINARYPARSRVSDGTIGDSAHASSVSDHNPNNNGVVTAIDITQDPNNGADMNWLAEVLTKNNDPRIKYIIWDRRLWMSGKWVNYYGENPHTKHLHLSVSADPNLYDNGNQWNLNKQEDVMDREAVLYAYLSAGMDFPTEGQYGYWVGRASKELSHALYDLNELIRWKAGNYDKVTGELVKKVEDVNKALTKALADDKLDKDTINTLTAQLVAKDAKTTAAIEKAQATAPSATKAPYFVNLVKAILGKQ